MLVEYVILYLPAVNARVQALMTDFETSQKTAGFEATFLQQYQHQVRKSNQAGWMRPCTKSINAGVRGIFPHYCGRPDRLVTCPYLALTDCSKPILIVAAFLRSADISFDHASK